jgi:hypothetical protein
VVKFLLLTRPSFLQSDWEIPERKLFTEAVNGVECQLLTTGSELLSVLQWANNWGDIGLIGLSSRDLDKLKQFREYVDAFTVGENSFTLYPKDCLVQRYNITTLLREDLSTYDPLLIPRALFWRNKMLDGNLRVTHVKHFSAEEKTKDGQSKKDWKLLKLQGDEKFMRSIYPYHEKYRFQVGSSFIQIRGGLRVEEEVTRRREDNEKKGDYRALENVSKKAITEVMEQENAETGEFDVNDALVTICQGPGEQEKRGEWADNVRGSGAQMNEEGLPN